MAYMIILNTNDLFDSTHLDADLAHHSVWGGLTTFSSQGAQFLLTVTGTAVLARLLTPADYGLVGMVTVIIGFVAIFKDAGLSMATVQRNVITHEQISTLFWLNTLISAALGFCVLAGSPLVALFYGKPELASVTAALSFSFIISGLTLQHQALQRRHMRFGILAGIQIAAQIAATAIAIVLALFGWRYWALVGGTLTQALAGTVLTFVFCPWIPGRMRMGTGVRDMVTFGGNLTGYQFLNFFARNLDNVLIGRVWGEDALGLYSRAYGFLLLPLQQVNGPVNAVASPVLSHLQRDPERFRNYFCKMLQVSTFFTFPLIAFMVITSRELVVVLFGSQWEPMIPIFRILAISAFAQAVVNLTGVLYMSLGLGNRAFRWGVMGSFWLVLSFFVGLPYGPMGVAVSYTCAMLLMTIPALLYAIAPSLIRLGDIGVAIGRNAVCTGASTFVVFLIKISLPATMGCALSLVLLTASFGISYVAMHALMLGSVHNIKNLYAICKSLMVQSSDERL